MARATGEWTAVSIIDTTPDGVQNQYFRVSRPPTPERPGEGFDVYVDRHASPADHRRQVALYAGRNRGVRGIRF